MASFDFETLRPVLEQPRQDLCQNVLALCLPHLPPEPAEGWLKWTYHFLTLGLYPEAETTPDPDTAGGAALYVQALEWALDRERAPVDPLTDPVAGPPEEAARGRGAGQITRVPPTHIHVHKDILSQGVPCTA